jgi:hypothetical protein
VDAQNLARVETRPLGELERILHGLHRKTNFIAAFVLHLRGPLNAPLVRRALDFLQRSEPLLRVHIRPTGIRLRRGVPFYSVERAFVTEGTTEIALRETTGDWRAVLKDEFAMAIPDGKGPRVRATLVAAGGDGVARLILISDHAICDVPSWLVMARKLLAFLADPSLKPATEQGILPALEDIDPPRKRGTRRRDPPIRLPMRRRRPEGTVIEERTLTKAETAAMRAAAHSHRTTVHGTIGAAALMGIRDVFSLDAMTLLSNFEFRRLTRPPLPADAIGAYVDSLRTRHALDRPFWDLAREIPFKLIATIASDRNVASVFKLPTLRVALTEGPKLLLSGYRVDGVSLTTGPESGLGRNHGPFELVDITTGLSSQFFGPGIFITGIEHEGCQKLMLGYAPHTVPTPDVLAVADRMMTILRDLPA